jgi:hypothetical protein
LQNVQRLLLFLDLFCSSESLFVIIEVFVDSGSCANTSSTMLLFVKKLSNCIDNGDSIAIRNTNPINIIAKINL